MAPDFAIAKDVAEKSATLLKNDGQRAAAQELGLRRQRRARDGPDRHGDLRRRRRQRARDAVRADHQLRWPRCATAAGSGTVDYVQGYDLDGQLVPVVGGDGSGGTRSAGGLPPATPRSPARTAGCASRSRPRCPRPAPSPRPAPAPARPTRSTRRSTTRRNTSTLPAGTAWRWTTHFTVPAAPAGSNGWQLKVFVKNQSSGAAVRRRARDRPAPDQHRRLRRRRRRHRRLVDRRLGRPRADGEVARRAGAAAGRVHRDVRGGRDARARPARLRQRDRSAVGPVRVGPAGLAGSSRSPRPTAAASSANKVVIFAFDDGTEGIDRGGNDQNAGLQLPGWQDALISAVAAVNPNMVVVLNTGDPVYMPWLGEREVGARDVVPRPGRRPRDRRRPDRRTSTRAASCRSRSRRLGRAAALPDRRPGLQPGRDRDPEQQHGHRGQRRQLPALPGRVPERSDPGAAHLPDGRLCRRTASSRATAGTTSTASRRCSRSATACRTRRSSYSNLALDAAPRRQRRRRASTSRNTGAPRGRRGAAGLRRPRSGDRRASSRRSARCAASSASRSTPARPST